MKSILLIEDDVSTRDPLIELLHGAGYHVNTAVNGREAFDALRQRKPDLILLDLVMPLMNGWEFIDALKSDSGLATIPIVVLTAHGGAHIPEADGFLVKPLLGPGLLDAVKEHCG